MWWALCAGINNCINILSIHTNVGIICTTMLVVVEVVASSGPMYTEGRQNASTIGRAYYMHMYRCLAYDKKFIYTWAGAPGRCICPFHFYSICARNLRAVAFCYLTTSWLLRLGPCNWSEPIHLHLTWLPLFTSCVIIVVVLFISMTLANR